MKLTRRQQEVAKKLVTLYRSLSDRPIHYSELANYIGVNRFTAYDMLKTLEEKGLVVSTYQVSESSGPGRSAVVFEPTDLARQLMASIGDQIVADEWQSARQQFLQVGFGKFSGYTEILDRFLPPEEDSELRYSGEILISVLSNLQRVRSSAAIQAHWASIVSDSQKATASQLTLFNGFALGLLSQGEEVDDLWWGELWQHVHRVHELIGRLTAAQCAELAALLERVMTEQPFVPEADLDAEAFKMAVLGDKSTC